MAKVAKAGPAKKPAASAKGDKAPAPSKAKAPAKVKGAAAAVNGATAAAVSLKQLPAVLAESHDLPKRQVEAVLGEFVQSLAKHLQQAPRSASPASSCQVSSRAARMGHNPATAEQIQIKASKQSLGCHSGYDRIPAGLASLTRTSSTDSSF